MTIKHAALCALGLVETIALVLAIPYALLWFMELPGGETVIMFILNMAGAIVFFAIAHAAWVDLVSLVKRHQRNALERQERYKEDD
jgi:hypothetical protein